MGRPSVLIVEPAPERRHALARGLAEAGYEVVPAASAEEGRRFGRGLDPALIVAPAELPGFGDGAILEALASGESAPVRTLVLLGAGEGAETLPAAIRWLAVEGLSETAILERLELVLLGRELGVEADVDFKALIGDLALKPLLELLRSLHQSRVSGVVSFSRGELGLEAGRVVAARCGAARGVKALCRLARFAEEPFRITRGTAAGTAAGERDVDADLQTLTLLIIEDSLGEFPDPRTVVATRVGPALFNTRFEELQQQILSLAHGGVALRELLDALAATDGAIVQEVFRLGELGVLEQRAPAPAVHVVTDSTCDLPPALAREHGIEVVPLSVRFGERVYGDRVDLQPGEFYRLLEQGKAHPVSSPPPAEAFTALYGRLLPGGDVVSVHLSSRLSETAATARGAAELALATTVRKSGPPPRLEVIDSRGVGLGLGLLALFAARMAARGEPATMIAARLGRIAPRIGLFFIVDTLEYLARGGRIGKARALLGGLLGIKPILEVVEGEVTAVDRVRGGRAAHAHLVELVCARVDPKRPVIVGLTHAKAPVWADQLRQLLAGKLRFSELITSEIGPVVGTHAGPGTVGLAVFQPEAEEEARLLAPLER